MVVCDLIADIYTVQRSAVANVPCFTVFGGEVRGYYSYRWYMYCAIIYTEAYIYQCCSQLSARVANCLIDVTIMMAVFKNNNYCA